MPDHLTSDEIKMREVAGIINQIRLASGNAKKDILKEHCATNELLCKVLYYTYNMQLKFKIKVLPEQPLIEEFTLDGLFEKLDYLAAKKSATKNDKLEMAAILSDPMIRDLVTGILNKDIRAGIGNKTVALYVDVPPEEIVQLAEAQEKIDKFLEKQTKAIIQVKLDGVRNKCFVSKSGEVVSMSRRNTEFDSLDVDIFKNAVLRATAKLRAKYGDVIIDGEVIARLPGYNKKSTFQKLQSFIFREDTTSGDVKITDIEYHLYDFVIDKMPQLKRLETLVDIEENEFVKVLPYTIESNLTQTRLKELRDAAIDDGYEGILMKNLKGKYQEKRTRDWVKYKKFITIDLPVVGVIEGTGKQQGSMGALQCEMPDGQIQKVGTGFDDAFRQKCWDDPNSIIGKTVELEYQELTEDGLLKFVSFECVRHDK